MATHQNGRQAKEAVIEQDGVNNNSTKEPVVEDYGKVNADEEDEMEIYGYKRSERKTRITWALIFVTAGFARLLFHWWPHWKLYAMFEKCPLNEATHILVVDNYQAKHKSYFVEPIEHVSVSQISRDRLIETNKTGKSLSSADEKLMRNLPIYLIKPMDISQMKIYLQDGSSRDVNEITTVRIKKILYVWCEGQGKFQKLIGLDKNLTLKQLRAFRGYSVHERYVRKHVFGDNRFNVTIENIFTLICLEVMNPLYIFQAFSLVMWYLEGYVYYLWAIVTMSLFGITSSIFQTYKDQRSLSNIVQLPETITVCRDVGSGKKYEDDAIYEDVLTTDLVPGDIVVIPKNGFECPCDIVLLCGTCIVDESMLTGESDPAYKTELPSLDRLYDEREDTNHTLFAGTKILQGQYFHGKVHGVVLRTGFLTTKGSLVRSILYPPPVDFIFDVDIYRLMWILVGVAVSGSIYSAVAKASRGLTLFEILVKSLDLFTIVIPPALPATMTVGRLYALRRLQRHRIKCMNPRVITIGGSINCICFDKTGTLTEDGLDMWGVVSVENSGKLGSPIRDPSKMTHDHRLKLAMTSCHSLTILTTTLGLSGDPLDVKMFESTGWKLEVTVPSKIYSFLPIGARAPIVSYTEDYPRISILRQFYFSSLLQRMSVITKSHRDSNFVVYTKGSPETIQSLCIPSTVPSETNSVLRSYTEKGYRVIAVANKVLTHYKLDQMENLRRDQVESDLTFSGLIILENRLKKQTTAAIKQLRAANMKIIMVTGDHVLTAVSVARECGLLLPSKTVIDVTVDKSEEEGDPKICFTANAAMSPMEPTTIIDRNGSSGNDIELGARVKGDYSFAMTGPTWTIIRNKFPELLPKILVKGVIFARMTPDQKKQLVQELQLVGYHVAMCGDGANDCGALRTAHVGVSLSGADASVAAPFISHVPNISCMPRIIRESRVALVTLFGIFKFMVLYSLLEFTSTFILYNIDSNLTDFQFLFIDVGLVVNFMFFFGINKPFRGPIAKTPPPTRLLSFVPLFSMAANLLIMVSTQIVSYHMVQKFAWFTPFKYTELGQYKSFENYAVFTVSQFQYIILAFIFSHSKPYREPIYKNILLFLSLLGMTGVCVHVTLYPDQWLKEILQLEFPPDTEFPVFVLMLATSNLVLCLFVEYFIVGYLIVKKLKLGSSGVKPIYETVEAELDSTPEWPPTSTTSSLECTSETESVTEQTCL